MRTTARTRLALVALVTGSLGAACSLIRSFDGFSDGVQLDGSTGPDEAGEPGDTGTDDGGGIDGGVLVGDIVCSDFGAIWASGGNGSLTGVPGPYLHGMAQEGDHLYVVGGVFQSTDAAAAGDGGLIVKIDKAPPHTASVVLTEQNQPTAIVATPSGVYFAASKNVYRLDDASTPVKTLTNGILDMAADTTGLYFVENWNQPSAKLDYVSDFDFSNFASRSIPYVARVVLGQDGVYLTRWRDDAGGGLARYEENTVWADAEATVVETVPVLAVADNADRIAWGAIPGVAPDKQFVASAEMPDGAPTKSSDPSDSVPYGVAVGPGWIFVRYIGAVKVLTLSGQAVPGCTKALVAVNESSLPSNRVAQSVVIDGEWVYFMTPQRVYRMRVTVVTK